MNLVRHDLGYSKTEERFPAKNTCLAIYSRTVNAESPLDDVLGANFPWCAGWESELKALFGAYVEAKQQQNVLDYDDLLLYWAQMMQVDDIALDVSSPVRSRPGRRVPGHEPPAGIDPAGPQARRQGV